MLNQKRLRLSVSRLPGETIQHNRNAQRAISGDDIDRKPIPPEKLFADLLKRQAREAMAGVTECPPVAMPHALARLEGVRAFIVLATQHELIPGAETLRSEAQLMHASTVADLLACIDLTRKEHRAPVFLNSRDTELSKLNEKIDLLAGMVALALPDAFKMPGAFCNESEVEP